MSTIAQRDGAGTAAAVTPRRARGRLVLATGLLTAFFAVAAAPSPLLLVFQDRWHLATSQVTLAFAVYTLAILVTLLTAGSLSDHVGRRPVLAAALVLQIAVCAMFVVASGPATLIAARIVQGVATGLASGTLTAAVIDATPRSQRVPGSVIAGAAPLAGLALGGLLGALADRLLAHPITILFTAAAVVFAAGLAATPLLGDDEIRRPGALQSLIPHVTLPSGAMAEFTATIPMAIATWSLGGLYLGLAPTLTHHFFRVNGAFDGGLAIATLCGASLLAALASQRVSPRRLATVACAMLATGGAIVWTAVQERSLGLFLAATIVSGAGFGIGFGSLVRLLTPLAPPSARAGLLSTMYLVNYLAFGIPVLIAGWLIETLNISTTTTLYCALIAATSLLSLAARVLSTTTRQPQRTDAPGTNHGKPLPS